MQFLQLNNFLQSLSLALLSSIGQMALLAVLLLAFIAFNKPNARIKYLILVATNFVGFVLFIFSLLKNIPASTNNIYWEQLQLNFLTKIILQVVGIAYLLIAFFFVFRLTIKSVILQHKYKHLFATEINALQEFINTRIAQLNLRLKVVVKVSNQITTPFTIGFIKPVILLPLAAINQLSPSQLEAILLHELAHIQRKDYLINLVLLMLECVMFFNPVFKYINKQITITREFCCDDMVIENNYKPHLYAEALLVVAQHQTKSLQTIYEMQAINGNNKQLLFRVKRMLNLNTVNKTKISRQFGYSFLLLLFAGLLFFSIGFINTHVQQIVKTEFAQFKVHNLKPIQITEKKPLHVSAIVLKKKNNKNKIAVAQNQQDKLITEENSIAKNELKQQFKNIDELMEVSNSNVYKAVVMNDSLQLAANSNDIAITPLVIKKPASKVEKFFVPASSNQPASIIIVTTTEKANGKKITTIEITNGEGTAQ